jgi:hypothetical protein
MVWDGLYDAGGTGVMGGSGTGAGRVDSTGGTIASTGSTGRIAFFLAGIFFSSSRISIVTKQI